MRARLFKKFWPVCLLFFIVGLILIFLSSFFDWKAVGVWLAFDGFGIAIFLFLFDLTEKFIDEL